MPIHTIELRSAVLDKRTTVRVYVNDRAKPPYPTFYLLHGLSDDSSVWLRRTLLERYSQNFPFLIVMPDGARSFYTDSPLGNYESYLADELVGYIDRTFQTRTETSYRAIGGLSMGGFGALRLGFSYPEQFGAVAAHSAAIGWDGEWAESDSAKIVAAAHTAAELDIRKIITACPAKKRPHLYFDCGKKDRLFAANRSLHQFLQRKKIPHTYAANPGDHEWSYWDKHIVDALEFLTAKMKLEKIDYHNVAG